MSNLLLKTIISICTGYGTTPIQKQSCIAKINKCIEVSREAQNRHGLIPTENVTLNRCIGLINNPKSIFNKRYDSGYYNMN